MFIYSELCLKKRCRILNTMKNDFVIAKNILAGTGISVSDAARFIKNILDAKDPNSNLSDIQFCWRVIEKGKQHVRTNEVSFKTAFGLYFDSKRNLRNDSIRDIRCMGNRLLKTDGTMAGKNMSEISVSECESWLLSAFDKVPQFNKARAMLHGLFEFAIRRQWCEKNPVKYIERRKTAEKEILPLNLAETNRLMQSAKREGGDCAVATAILIYAGIRPREVRRLTWNDIDTDENTITVRSQCSKTGGVRHVEIEPKLRRILSESIDRDSTQKICPNNWLRRWRKIRDNSGFKGRWVNDVLRHTYASFHAKHYADLPRLQLNMGHRDLSLLRSRYVNMHGISRAEAKRFFGCST